jgi:hypothetical protein
VCLWFGDEEYEGLGMDYTFSDGVLCDSSGDAIETRMLRRGLQPVGPLRRRTHVRCQVEDNEGGDATPTAEVTPHQDQVSQDTAVFVLGQGDDSCASSGGMWTIHLLDHTYLMQDMQQLHPAGTCTAADTARRDNITATLLYPLDAGLNLLTFTADDNTRAMHSWSPRCNVMVEGKQQVEEGEKASRWVVGGGEKTRRWMLQASLRMPGPPIYP